MKFLLLFMFLVGCKELVCEEVQIVSKVCDEDTCTITYEDGNKASYNKGQILSAGIEKCTYK